MREIILQTIVRLKFTLTSRDAASSQARKEMERTVQLCSAVEPSQAARSVRVPSMAGIDEEMRDWSLFMILEHNTIVNRAITSLVGKLAWREAVDDTFDMKKDVIPAKHADAGAMGEFRSSVEDYLRMIPELPTLRGTGKYRHPVFADLDAHGWHCMLAFHLMLHRRQSEKIVKILGC
jgi:hypothetical protein